MIHTQIKYGGFIHFNLLVLDGRRNYEQGSDFVTVKASEISVFIWGQYMAGGSGRMHGYKTCWP
jgi:hypothetical protein